MQPNKYMFVRYVRTLRAGPQISGGAQQGYQTKQKQPKKQSKNLLQLKEVSRTSEISLTENCKRF